MNPTTTILIAILVLLGCAVLKGVNPLDVFLQAVIWTLYRAAAVMLAIARTTDAAYMRIKQEYRNSVSEISQHREALHRAEEARAVTVTVHSHTPALGFMPSNAARQ
jgi:uncharacterized membrane protein